MGLFKFIKLVITKGGIKDLSVRSTFVNETRLSNLPRPSVDYDDRIDPTSPSLFVGIADADGDPLIGLHIELASKLHIQQEEAFYAAR